MGALLEAGGLVTIGIGLSEVREKFTDKPSIPTRLNRGIDKGLEWLDARFFGPPTQTIHVQGIGSTASVGSLRLSRVLGFPGTFEARLQKLQALSQEFEDAISQLRHDLADEATSRKSGDEDMRVALSAAEDRTKKRIADAVAGGLSREALGLSFFLAGLALTTWAALLQ